MMICLFLSVLGDPSSPVGIVVRILGLAILSGLVVIIFSMAYRWYSRERIGVSLAILIGASAIALWLNTLHTLSQFVDPITEPLTVSVALINTTALAVGAVAAVVGSRVGDRLALSTGAFLGDRSIDGDVSPLVKAVGRFITVQLPEKIDDIDGYDPVDESVKTSLRGRTMIFPRGLTVTELRDRLIDRLRDNHNIGHVDVDIKADGSVTYLAVGSKISGLGPTLAPGSVAIAVSADPPHHATPGDTVQLWSVGETPERLATGELRGVAGDVVTVVIDDADVGRFDGDSIYRLITLSSDSRPDREFAAMLRTADETMGVIEVTEDSPLLGSEIGQLDVTVIAVKASDGSVDGIPSRTRLLEVGDTIYAIAKPETLRRIEPASETST